MWHNGDSNISALERKTLNIYHVLEDHWIVKVLEENQQKSTRRLSEELDASKYTTHRQIKTLGKSYSSSRSVPYELTPQQAQRRVDICPQLFGNPMDDRFMKKIATSDEHWVDYRNPDASKQCLGPRQPAKVIVKKTLFGPKVMLCF